MAFGHYDFDSKDPAKPRKFHQDFSKELPSGEAIIESNFLEVQIGDYGATENVQCFASFLPLELSITRNESLQRLIPAANVTFDVNVLFPNPQDLEVLVPKDSSLELICFGYSRNPFAPLNLSDSIATLFRNQQTTKITFAAAGQSGPLYSKDDSSAVNVALTPISPDASVITLQSLRQITFSTHNPPLGQKTGPEAGSAREIEAVDREGTRPRRPSARHPTGRQTSPA